MSIAIIPARGGSTRIPRKNIKDFLGKPIIAYSIEAAIKAKIFDQIIVSTDDKEIADVAKQYGASVPFMRPKELGENNVSVAEVVHHALTWTEKNGQEHSFACVIVATAPFLNTDRISEGFGLIQENDVDTVMSVAKFPFPIQRAFKKNEQGRMKFYWPEHEFSQSNNLPESFHDAAQFYWINTKRFMQTKSLLGKEVIPIVLPEYLVRDIDTPEDWETAELMYEACQKKGLICHS